MTAGIGVLCARVRVEEKQVLAMLADAGVPAMPLPLTHQPLQVPPKPTKPSGAADSAVDGVVATSEVVWVIFDRLQDRAAAAALIPLWRAGGAQIIDAGIAAGGSRVDVAIALGQASLPRPTIFVAATEEAALEALEKTGYPATLLPMTPGQPGIALADRDIAEAIVEHRITLGGASELVCIVQHAIAHHRGTVIVSQGKAIAIDNGSALIAEQGTACRLAVAAAAAVNSTFCGVEIAITDDGMVVWDINPVPDFRDAYSLMPGSVSDTIAAMLLATFDQRDPMSPLNKEVASVAD